MTDARIGQTLLGKLKVHRVLGEGGAGTVYEVTHLLTQHKRALKVLRPDKAGDAKAAARLMREAGVAGRVGSPRLVQTFDVGQLEDGSPFVLMELLEGRTLSERLREGPLPIDEALRLAAEVGEGLTAAHAAGVVHRDLTPRNVFLVGAGAAEHVKLLDFGLSKNLPGHTDRFGKLTDTGAVMGTPHYLSPEQARGQAVDARTDQYALGLVLYECLSGRRPYEGDTLAEVLGNIVGGHPVPLETLRTDLSPRVITAVRRAMRPDPADRFASVQAFVDALGPGSPSTLEKSHESLAFAATDAVVQPAPLPRAMAEAQTAPALPAPAPPRKDRRPLIALAVGGVLAIGIAFGATALVLKARQSHTNGTSGRLDPEPLDSDPRSIAGMRTHLEFRYEQRDYEGCMRLVDEHRVQLTVPLLELLVLCADGAGDRERVMHYCHLLSLEQADAYVRNDTCRRFQNPITVP